MGRGWFFETRANPSKACFSATPKTWEKGRVTYREGNSMRGRKSGDSTAATATSYEGDKEAEIAKI